MRKGIRAAGGVLAKNPRAGHRPMRTPPPGDPSRTDVHPSEMTWTVVADEAAMMTAVLLDAEAPSWGLVWQEASRQGNLNMERCKALGITDGECVAAQPPVWRGCCYPLSLSLAGCVPCSGKIHSYQSSTRSPAATPTHCI